MGLYDQFSVVAILVGAAIAALALVAMVLSARRPASRLRALGFVYVGLSVVIIATAMLLIPRLGSRLPFVVGLPLVAFLLLMAVQLYRQALRAFAQVRGDSTHS